MATPPSHDPVTVSLHTARAIHDQLLGALQARGTTMQEFFANLMRHLVEHTERIDTIRSWSAAPRAAITPRPLPRPEGRASDSHVEDEPASP